MQITYVGPHLAVDFQGIRCEQGDSIEFPDAIALRALEQDCWHTDDPSYTPPAPPADTAPDADHEENV